jgi:glutamyl-tRNA synthetase
LPNAEIGKVCTRFPPEASGYLHIGHAKAALLNNYFARKYHGKLILRFDDTNPAKEKAEYEHAIIEDLKLLDIKPDVQTFTSDYFDKCLEFCERLIREGKAFVDDTEKEIFTEEKRNKIESRNRNNSVEKNLQMFEEMKKGTEYGRKCAVRAKINMQADNATLRDPVLMRCKAEPHPRTGDKYKIYPTYDFACPIVDSIEGVTHTLRTSEYNDRNEQYYWICDALGIRKPFIWDYSRLNFTYTVMSKRKLTKLVDMGAVEGWDDPRFPTVRGLVRRGLTVDALRNFVLEQGASRSVATMQWEKLWALNKKLIDPIVPRYTALPKDHLVKFHIDDGPSELEVRKNLKHKKNSSLGEKDTYYYNVIYLDSEDANAIEDNEEVTLMNWGNAIVRAITKDNNGKVISLSGSLNPKGSAKTTKKKLTWLPANDKATISVKTVHFDYIITKEKIEPEDDFDKVINYNSKHETMNLGELELKHLKEGDLLQLERRGYYRVDKPYVDEQNVLVLFNIPDGHLAK